MTLPTNVLPKFKVQKQQLSKKEYMDALSTAVAEIAWDRRYRLDRPNANLKVTFGCDCKYCERPNIFQTALYRKKHVELLERQGRSHNHERQRHSVNDFRPPRKSSDPPQRSTSFQCPRERVVRRQPQRSMTVREYLSTSVH